MLFRSNKDNLTSEEKSLMNIFMSIAKRQDFIDCSPIFYIEESKNKGYILEKKLSGMNNLHILSYDHTSQSWKVINKINKIGKDLFVRSRKRYRIILKGKPEGLNRFPFFLFFCKLNAPFV